VSAIATMGATVTAKRQLRATTSLIIRAAPECEVWAWSDPAGVDREPTAPAVFATIGPMVPVGHGPQVPIGPPRATAALAGTPRHRPPGRGRFVLDPPSRPPRPSRGFRAHASSPSSV